MISPLTRGRLWVLIVALGLPMAILAQEAPDDTQMQAMLAAMAPGEHHAHLAALAGTWDAEVSMWMAPGSEPMVSEGTAEMTMLMGGRVLQQVFKGSFMGMPFEGMGFIGYDNVRQQYVSTWMDNMGTGIAMETGTCEGGKIFRSSGEYSDATTGSVVTMRSVHRIESPTRTTLEMYAQGPDGTEHKTMQVVYTRKS